MLLSIQLCLEDRPGALASAAEALSDLGINMMVSECTPAGFRHAIWSIIGLPNSDSVSSLMERKKELDQSPDPDELENLKIQTQAEMHAIAEVLRFELLHKNNALPKERRFLRQRVLDKALVISRDLPQKKKREYDRKALQATAERIGELLLSSNAWKRKIPSAVESDPLASACLNKRIDGVNDKIMERQFPAAVQIRWMSRMAYYSFSGSSANRPLRFSYDAAGQTARYEGGSEEWWANSGLDLNERAAPAIATLHTRDKYARVTPVKRNSVSMVSLPYTIGRQNAPEDSSRGVLAVLARKLAEGSEAKTVTTNFLHQAQMYSGFDSNHETGALTFVVEHDGVLSGKSLPQNTAIDEELAQIRNEPPPPKNSKPMVRLGSAEVQTLGAPRLFISTRFADRYFVELLRKSATSAGFTPVLGEAGMTQDVLGKVRASVRSCDAAAFVVFASAEELFQSNLNRLSWIQQEMGMVMLLEKPFVKFVDNLLKKHVEDLFPADRNKSTLFFDRWSTSDADLQEDFTAKLENLRQEMKSH